MVRGVADAAGRLGQVGPSGGQGLRAVAAGNGTDGAQHHGRQCHRQRGSQRWAFTIIFCGHFPAGTYEFSVEESEEESRGHWYFRQLLGSANIEGGALFHLMSGNLSHQIEHHLFPDLPAHRYGELAPRVRAICEQYGLPYNSGGLSRQFGSVVAKICRMALPGGRSWTARAFPVAA